MLTTCSCGKRRSQCAPPQLADEDIRHALRNLIAVAADPRDDDVTLFLGPDWAVNLIEVGVLSTNEGPLIIHAMAARAGRGKNSKE